MLLFPNETVVLGLATAVVALPLVTDSSAASTSLSRLSVVEVPELVLLELRLASSDETELDEMLLVMAILPESISMPLRATGDMSGLAAQNGRTWLALHQSHVSRVCPGSADLYR